MSPLLPPRERSKDDDARLIPMINVVFLLIIFFMVVGQVSTHQAGPVELPVASSDKLADNQPLLLTLKANGELLLDEQPLAVAELATVLKARLATAQTPPAIAIRADQQATAGQLQQLLIPVRELGFARISLLSQKTLEARP